MLHIAQCFSMLLNFSNVGKYEFKMQNKNQIFLRLHNFNMDKYFCKSIHHFQKHVATLKNFLLLF